MPSLGKSEEVFISKSVVLNENEVSTYCLTNFINLKDIPTDEYYSEVTISLLTDVGKFSLKENTSVNSSYLISDNGRTISYSCPVDSVKEFLSSVIYPTDSLMAENTLKQNSLLSTVSLSIEEIGTNRFASKKSIYMVRTLYLQFFLMVIQFIRMFWQKLRAHICSI